MAQALVTGRVPYDARLIFRASSNEAKVPECWCRPLREGLGGNHRLPSF
jgi:hypothetical protein